jgi:UDP-N-acetylmuramyl pentapeptide synthase
MRRATRIEEEGDMEGKRARRERRLERVKNRARHYLRPLARFKLHRCYKQIIGITGSIGKSSAKAATVTVLESKFSVDQSFPDYNSELGLLCSTFHQRAGFNSVRLWRRAMLGATWNFLSDHRRYEKLVLEMGVAGPSGMSQILKSFRPEIAVFTGIAPGHHGAREFADEQTTFEEKAKLVRRMRRGTAILNRDDPFCRSLESEDMAADRLWYGRRPEDRPLGSSPGSFPGSLPESLPPGLYFDQLSSSAKGITAQVHVSPSETYPELRAASHTLFCPILGEQHIYVLLPAILTGLVLGIDLQQCCSALSDFALPPGRLNLIPGVGSTTIIDSTWNASPRAVEAAIKTLGDYPAERRIALLGCIMNLGDVSESAHREAGRLVSRYADMLITVGPEARLIGEEASARGMPTHLISSFEAQQDATDYLKDIIRRGDVILVKGSSPLRLDRTVKSLMRDPDQADRLLVRQ